MINKITLNSIISKYYLSGLVESVKWQVKDKNLTIDFMSPSEDMLGKITSNNFPLENVDLAIYDTSKFIKLTAVLLGDILLSVEQKNNEATKLHISDLNFNIAYSLANPKLIKGAAKVTEPSEYQVEIKLEQEQVANLIKSKNSIGEDNTLILETSIDTNGNPVLLFVFGEETEHANRITFQIPIESNSNIKLPFPSDIFKEILVANKDMVEGTLYINEDGILKLKFTDKKELNSEYFIIRKQDFQ